MEKGKFTSAQHFLHLEGARLQKVAGEQIKSLQENIIGKQGEQLKELKDECIIPEFAALRQQISTFEFHFSKNSTSQNPS